ncbi:RNA-binding S4 domain-containing protein [Phenylobacterium sp.]|uniref:RNA-binding S4 domain-containing protein n=1 Tax=Phenylobacterium sp. TaxID=1871053 RepID=UPI002F410BE5
MSEDNDTDLGAGEGDALLRLDKWLWFARFFKSRTLATRFLDDGHSRLRGAVVKAHARVRAGDVVTFTLHGTVRVVRILALGTRRGPAPEARALYDDLSPPVPPRSDATGPFRRDSGAGRPTKAERRALDRLRETER